MSLRDVVPERKVIVVGRHAGRACLGGGHRRGRATRALVASRTFDRQRSAPPLGLQRWSRAVRLLPLIASQGGGYAFTTHRGACGGFRSDSRDGGGRLGDGVHARAARAGVRREPARRVHRGQRRRPERSSPGSTSTRPTWPTSSGSGSRIAGRTGAPAASSSARARTVARAGRPSRPSRRRFARGARPQTAAGTNGQPTRGCRSARRARSIS
jgi:hypothetical protein